MGRHLRGEAVIAAPAGMGYRVRKFVRRNRGAVGTVGAVGAALMLGLGVATWQWQRAKRLADASWTSLELLTAEMNGRQPLDRHKDAFKRSLQNPHEAINTVARLAMDSFHEAQAKAVELENANTLLRTQKSKLFNALEQVLFAEWTPEQLERQGTSNGFDIGDDIAIWSTRDPAIPNRLQVSAYRGGVKIELDDNSMIQAMSVMAMDYIRVAREEIKHARLAEADTSIARVVSDAQRPCDPFWDVSEQIGWVEHSYRTRENFLGQDARPTVEALWLLGAFEFASGKQFSGIAHMQDALNRATSLADVLPLEAVRMNDALMKAKIVVADFAGAEVHARHAAAVLRNAPKHTVARMYMYGADAPLYVGVWAFQPVTWEDHHDSHIRTETDLAEEYASFTAERLQNAVVTNACSAETKRDFITATPDGMETFLDRAPCLQEALHDDFCMMVAVSHLRVRHALFAEAIAAADAAQTIWAKQGGGLHPLPLAIDAIAESRLHHPDEARRALAQLRTVVNDPEFAGIWVADPAIQLRLAEAEALIDPRAKP